MYLKNAWYVAGWERDLDDGLLARTICEEAIVLFRCENGKIGALKIGVVIGVLRSHSGV